MKSEGFTTISSEFKNLIPSYNKIEPKIEILNYDDFLKDNTMITILLREEDHTIGSILKEAICKMKGVEFCGYNVPHPLENKIVFRIQTYKDYSASEMFLKGLEDLEKVFNAIENKFTDSYLQYLNNK